MGTTNSLDFPAFIHRSSRSHTSNISKMASREEKMIARFMTLDRNHDGHITKKELTAAYGKDGHKVLEIEEWMKKFDTNKDGKIDITEFSKALGLDVEEMKQLQRELLKDESGTKSIIHKDVTVISSP